jgi:hypothetical protein
VPAAAARPSVLRPRALGRAEEIGRRIAQRERLPPEISFLEGRHVDRETLVRAVATARRWRVSPEQVLLDTGLITQTTYYRALSAHIGLTFSQLHESAVNWSAFRHPKGAAMARANIVPLSRAPGGMRIAVAPRGRALRRLISLSQRPEATRLLRDHLFLATPRAVAGVVQHGLHRQMLAHAGEHLATSAPHLSARGGLGLGQKSALAMAGAICLAAFVAAPAVTLAAIAVVLALIFAAVNSLRTAAVLTATRVRRRASKASVPVDRMPDGELPLYTLLVPLFKEAAVVPQLVKALRRLDYPALGSNGITTA